MVTGPETETAFCISCGDPNPVADGECADCLRKEITVVKPPNKPVEIERCAHCGAMPVREHWDQPTSLLEAVEQAAISSLLIPEALEDPHIGVRVREEDASNYIVDVEVDGAYKGVPVEGHAPVKVRVQTVSCSACSRRHGGYFEAIVQVRQAGDGDVSNEQANQIAQIIEDEVRRLGGLSGSQSYLLKAEARHGGYDYFFGAKPVAKAVARRVSDRYGGKITQSSTLAGQQDGQEMYRLTLAVRLPRVTPGTILGYEEAILEVYGRQGNRVLCRTVPEGEGRTIEDRHLDHADLLEIRTMDVVYAEGNEGQIMDPDSYDTIQVRLPEGMASGDKVRAVNHRGRWAVLGPA